MVEQRRKRTVSKENASPHHLRRRRLQRRAQPAVEERAAAACERGGALHYREPPAARYLQGEQDRAPVILPHFHQLAGEALDLTRDDHRTPVAHDNTTRAHRDRCRSEERRVGKECRSRWAP